MLAPNQTLLLHDYFTRDRDLWLLCEKYDCDHDQMLAIIGEIIPHLPGKGLDYQAILNQDPIACDHLVLHCQRSIGQLDALYDRLISLFDSSSSHELQINKRTTVNTPPDWAKPSFSDGNLHWDTTKGTEKIETTTLENKQRFRILESAMKCLERGLKMQITLTQRKEKLAKEQLSKERPSKQKPSKENLQNPRTQQEHTPFSGMPGCTAMQAYKGMTGYELAQLQSESTSPEFSAPLASLREPSLPASANELGAPGWLYPTTGAALPQEASKESRHTTNNMAHAGNPREEKPVTTDLSKPSAPPRETKPPVSPVATCFQPVIPKIQPNPFAKFGPPKAFAYPPHLAELMPNRYPWRKELKEKHATQKANLFPLSANSAPPRETSFTSPEEEAPAYHQRE